MYEFNNIDDYNLDFNQIFTDAYKNWLDDNEKMNFGTCVVLKNKELYGVLLSTFNKMVLYKIAKNYYLPFAFEYDDDDKIIAFKGVNDKEYFKNKDKNYSVIRDYKKQIKQFISYNNGYIMYSVHNLNNNDFITYFYNQSLVLNHNNEPIILKDYSVKPCGFCHKRNADGIYSDGYIKVFVDGGIINYLRAISLESNGVLNLIDSYNYYKNLNYPDIERYARIFKFKNQYILLSKPYLNLITQEKFEHKMADLTSSYQIPNELIDFYNGDNLLMQEYQKLLNEYLENQKGIKLIKKS